MRKAKRRRGGESVSGHVAYWNDDVLNNCILCTIILSILGLTEQRVLIYKLKERHTSRRKCTLLATG